MSLRAVTPDAVTFGGPPVIAQTRLTRTSTPANQRPPRSILADHIGLPVGLWISPGRLAAANRRRIRYPEERRPARLASGPFDRVLVELTALDLDDRERVGDVLRRGCLGAFGRRRVGGFRRHQIDRPGLRIDRAGARIDAG